MKDEDLPRPWLKTLDGIRPTSLEDEYVDKTTLDFLREWAENEPDLPCLHFPKGKTMTYGDVYDSVKVLAGKLRDLGVRKGERVALMFGNTPHYVISHFACLAVGAIIVQTNPIYSQPELIHQMNDSNARYIISLTMFQEKIAEVMEDTPLEKAIFGNITDYLGWLTGFLGKLLGKIDDQKLLDRDDFYLWSDLLKGDPDPNFEPVEPDFENDVILLQYTAGTTGKSKGVMLTHKNASYNTQQTRSTIHMIKNKSGSILAALPLFHSFGMTVCMNTSLMMGTSMVLIPRFDAGQVIDLINNYEILFYSAVPTMMVALLDNDKIHDADFSSLVAVISGGAPLPGDVAREFNEVTGAKLVEGYGLSETSPVASSNPISDDLEPRIGTVGLPVPDTLFKVVDPEDFDNVLELGEVGEICIKGPQVFKGYWEDPENTDKALVDGWLRTGDIGKIDEDGFVSIIDRKKDIIIVSGYNVIPRNIEEVLYAHPKVKEAAVAGMAHRKKGEIPVAWIVVKRGETVTKEEIEEHCRENLAPHKVPREIYFRDELPKSRIGKILRRQLVDQQKKENNN